MLSIYMELLDKMDKKKSSVDNSKSSKIKYFCEKCKYSTVRESQWQRHINTSKHTRMKSINRNKMTVNIVTNKYFICSCGKKYKYCSGLSKHKKRCPKMHTINLNDEILKEEEILLKDESHDLRDILKDFMKSQTEFNKKIAEEITKPQTVYNDCHNNKMTINLFLNESCKDAMNLTDFVENLQITLEDLKFTKDNGYVEGVTNIFTKQLQDMKPTERPIHCSDKKRLQFYVKDDDKWQKDNDNKKIDQTLTNIKLKQTTKIGDWEKLHPNYKEDPRLLDEWQNMLAGITEDTAGNALKQKLALKRKIASYIELKDAMGIK